MPVPKVANNCTPGQYNPPPHHEAASSSSEKKWYQSVSVLQNYLPLLLWQPWPDALILHQSIVFQRLGHQGHFRHFPDGCNIFILSVEHFSGSRHNFQSGSKAVNKLDTRSWNRWNTESVQTSANVASATPHMDIPEITLMALLWFLLRTNIAGLCKKESSPLYLLFIYNTK